jgi:hypothetical protein
MQSIRIFEPALAHTIGRSLQERLRESWVFGCTFGFTAVRSYEAQALVTDSHEFSSYTHACMLAPHSTKNSEQPHSKGNALFCRTKFGQER